MRKTGIERGEDMMVGNRHYSEADMMRMQRDAEERVREMRNRASQTASQSASFMPSFAANPGGRSWTPGPNSGRRNQRARQSRSNQGQNNTQNRPEPAPVPAPAEQSETAQFTEPEKSEEYTPQASYSGQDEKKGTTIIEDIIGSIGVDGDTLLIIGLILILVNQKADTTLILALAYLLI